MTNDVIEINRLTSVCSDCGNCLYYCPIYNAELIEPDSPRGKINIIRSLMDGTLSDSPENMKFTERCLMCGSCEHNCSKGVEFVDLMIKFRNHISGGNKLSLSSKIKLNFVSSQNLKKLAGIFHLNPVKTKKKILLKKRTDNYEKNKKGKSLNFDILLFPGCYAEESRPEITSGINFFFEKKGFSVVSPEKIKYCGSHFIEQGLGRKFNKIKKKNLKIFSKYKFRYIVVPSGREVHTLKKFYDIKDVEIFELSEFLFLHLRDLKINTSFLEKNKKFTYHDPSYNINMLGIKEEPRYFLKKFGDQFVDERSWICCGYSGITDKGMEDTLKEITKKYKERLNELGVDAVVTSSVECYQHLLTHFKKKIIFFTDIFE
ncbi:MAG: (Fe-S)-binding protein [Acidobacteriota bacterium]